MFGKYLGDFLLWAFLGAFAVLAIKNANGFSTAIGTVIQPVEYESTLIASAGASGASSSGNNNGTGKSSGYPS